ncbi:hypothetical protein J437_LFUL007243 [Ladona fulva]|uniref:Uncharacterized protein n=1 Tax=Ladona fulva TaxID=123851 RepID=A0A8K0JXP0_LADFU|nr:hypothetical protein J437_LFUL007243 [Ladona fulva]
MLSSDSSCIAFLKMPPFIKVPTLYVLSLNSFIKILYDYVVETRENARRIRSVVLTSLHAGIKQHLIEIATENYRGSIYVLFDLLEVLLDQCTTKLHAVDEENCLWLSECAELYSKLEQCQATGLEELSIRVRLNPRNDLEAVSSMNSSFYRTLRHMKHLKVLVLRSVCDNEILRLLGRNCPHIEYLDVTSSWLVDDKGIRQLLLKDPDSCISEGGEYNWLEMKGSEQRSACCLGLREVRIQDTNTSLTGVLYLLIFASHLRSLGGFIYYRNVGDAVVKLATKIPSLTLHLAELWDTCLPPDKAEIIGKAAPNLTVLYTRADHLSNVSADSFPFLTSLTVDFDFHDQGHLLEAYLQLRGSCLRKLSLVDQKHAVSLTMLDKYCPSLVELSAKVFGGGRWGSRHFRGSKPLLPSLQTAHLRLGSNSTLRAILGGCHSLCHLDLTPESADDENHSGAGMFYVVGVDWPSGAQDEDDDGEDEVPENEFDEDPEDNEDYEDVGLEDAGIVEGLALNPNPKLTTLVVRREWQCGSVGLRSLIYSCPKLKSVGDLYHWKGILGGEFEVAEISQKVSENNWDLSLVYRGHVYPKRNGFPLWAPPNIDSDISDEEEDSSSER